MGAAAPVFTVAMGAAQYKAQGEIGKFNQRVNNATRGRGNWGQK